MTPTAMPNGAVSDHHAKNTTDFVEAHYGPILHARDWVLTAPVRVGDNRDERFELHISPTLLCTLLSHMDSIADVGFSRSGATVRARLRKSGGDS